RAGASTTRLWSPRGGPLRVASRVSRHRRLLPDRRHRDRGRAERHGDRRRPPAERGRDAVWVDPVRRPADRHRDAFHHRVWPLARARGALELQLRPDVGDPRARARGARRLAGQRRRQVPARHRRARGTAGGGRRRPKCGAERATPEHPSARDQLRQRACSFRRPRDHDLEAGRVMLAAVRPNSFNLPLFLHVLGATLTFGITATVAILGFAATRADPERSLWLRGLAFKLAFFVLVPAFIVMRAAAQWIVGKEYPGGHDEPGWVSVGFIVT